MKKSLLLILALVSLSLGTMAQNVCIPSVVRNITGGGTYCRPNTEITLEVDGSLNNAATWTWYSNHCGGTIVGTGETLNVIVTENRTYFVRGTGGCVGNISCASVEVKLDPNFDVTAPEVTLHPNDLEVANDEGECGAIVTFEEPEGIDDCSDVVVVTRIAGLDPGSFFPVGVTKVEYELSDNAGNKTHTDFNVTVVDRENPAIVCPKDRIVNIEAGESGAVVTYDAPVGSDNCPGAVTNLTAGLGSGAFFPLGVTTETYTVTDAAGNVAMTCSFNVTVREKEDEDEVPVIVCPDDLVVNNETGKCGAVVTYDVPVGTDNAAGAVTERTAGLGSGAFFPAGVTTETYTVTDAAGNVATCSFKVTVKDVELPVIVCPKDIVVDSETGESGAVVIYDVPVGSDNCPGAVTKLTAGLGSGAFFPVGVMTETYTVTDDAGNVVTCSFKVTVEDEAPPVIDCPNDIVVNNEAGKCGAIVTYDVPEGSDSSPGAVTRRTAGLGSGAFFPVGVTTETYTVTDAAGNVATCSFKVTVKDVELPVIVCSNDITVNNETGKCGAVVTYNVPAGSDNCSGVVTKLTVGLGSGAFFPVGTTTETFTATDAAGNVATCSFMVIVEDKELPTIVCPKDPVVNNETGKCGAVVKYDVPAGSDNCPGAVTKLTAGLGSGAFFPVGITTETYTVTDAAGNVATCSFKVTVKDKELPVIDCPNDIVVNNESGKCGAVVTYNVPEGSDNCPGAVTKRTKGLGSGAFFPVGITTETYTVTDDAGNEASCSFKVTVKDVELPVIVCPNDIVVNNDSGKCGAVVTYDVPEGSDNCPDAVTELTSGLGSGAFFPVGVTTETYTVTDDAGNEASCSFTVTVKDVEPPVIKIKNKETVLWPPNHKHHAVAIADHIESVSDNCGGITIEDVIIDEIGSDEPNNGKGDGNTWDDILIASDCRTAKLLAERSGNENGRVYVVTIAVMDLHGNISTGNFLVTVPHDQGKKGSAILDEIVYVENGCDFIFEEDLVEVNHMEADGDTDTHTDTGTDVDKHTETKDATADEPESDQVKKPSVYPNPFNDTFFLKFTARSDDHVKVELYNLIGMKITDLHEQDVEANKSYTWTLEPPSPSSNEYVLMIRGKITRQFVRVIQRK